MRCILSRETVTLRVRDADDLAQQIHMHEVQATAYSLINSCLVVPLTVPQTIPHGIQKGNTDGSEVAARYSRTVDRLATIELEARAYPLDWERQARLDAERERLLARKDRLNAELAAIRTPGRGTRAGVPGLYSIQPAPLRYGGGIEGERAGRVLTLDTRSLGAELRERLEAFLVGGSEALPYRYKANVCRYYPRDGVPADTRDLMRVLTSHLLPTTPYLSQGKTPVLAFVAQ